MSRLTKIYVACPWANRATAKDVAMLLRSEGFEVTSRWHDLWAEQDTQDPHVLRREAQMDWIDVRSCDVLLLLNMRLSEGKAVELGIALEAGKRVVAISSPSHNVFHHLPQVEWYQTVGKAIEAIQEIEADRQTPIVN